MNILHLTTIIVMSLSFLFALINFNKKYALYIIFTLIFLISAFRGANVGADTDGYIFRFNQMTNMNLLGIFQNISFEPAFVILNYLINIIFKHYQWLLIITSLIITISIANYVYKYSNNIYLSSILYIILVYSATMNLMRQYIAVSLILYSLHYVYEKKIIPTILLITLATLFHESAIIFYPFIIFCKIKITKQHVVLISLFSSLTLVIYRPIMKVFFTLVPKYTNYLNTDYMQSRGSISISLLIFYMFFYIIAMIYIVKEKHEEQKEKEKFYILTLFYYFYILIYILSTQNWIISRIAPYFQINMIILIPNAINRFFKDKNLRLLITIFVILIFSYFGFKSFNGDVHYLLPFKFFWDK